MRANTRQSPPAFRRVANKVPPGEVPLHGIGGESVVLDTDRRDTG